MKWEKIGRLITEEEINYAAMPIAKVMDEEKGSIRVFFSPRNKNNQSIITYLDFNITDPFSTVKISTSPLLLPGKIGMFDDSGVTIGNILVKENKVYLYYTGWNLCKRVPFNNSIGLAILDQDYNLLQRYDGPIMTRTIIEPSSCASPFVLFENGLYKMWYSVVEKWKENGDNVKHYYNIKYAESNDGINWTRNGTIAIDFSNEEEYALGKPFVIYENNIYKMWYSTRGDHYTIGYAESNDGIKWERKDEQAGICVSQNGWDSEMIEFPCIFDYKKERYMIYNGNSYGRSGMGLAKLVH